MTEQTSQEQPQPQDPQQSYDLKLDLLGHEIFRVKLGSTSTTDRWVLMTILSIFCVMTLIATYGDKIVTLIKNVL